jgi:hypothetical protein
MVISGGVWKSALRVGSSYVSWSGAHATTLVPFGPCQGRARSTRQRASGTILNGSAAAATAFVALACSSAASTTTTAPAPAPSAEPAADAGTPPPQSDAGVEPPPPCDGKPGTFRDQSLAVSSGETRHSYLHVPSAYTCRSKWPLLVDFHGTGLGGATDTVEESWALSEMVSVADKEGFLVVRPRSRSRAMSGGFVYQWDINPGEVYDWHFAEAWAWMDRGRRPGAGTLATAQEPQGARPNARPGASSAPQRALLSYCPKLQ